jgi:hypothetical protein
MSTVGEREKKEREVLATLLLCPDRFKELPERFTESAFELQDYRSLFQSVKALQELDGCLTHNGILQLLPHKRDLIETVIQGTERLNGNLKARAAVLLIHTPWAIPAPGLPQQSGTLPGEGHEGTLPSLPEGKKRDAPFEFKLLTGMEIAAMDIPPKEWLIENLLTAKSVNFLAGEEGCGKSLLAMNLALAVATGAGYWLKYPIAQSGKVLYLNNEMAFDDYARRMKAMMHSLSSPGEVANLIAPREVPSLVECWDALNRTCQELQPRLLVIDCLYFAHDEDESDSARMKALMRQVMTLRDRYGLAVLLIHHTKKGARYEKMHNDLMRGSSVFGGVADTVLQMMRSGTLEGKRILKPTKFRHVSDENRSCRLLSCNPETLWFSDEGETDEAEHISKADPTAQESIDFREFIRPGEEVTRKGVIERVSILGYDPRTVDRLLQKAKANGELKCPKYGVYAL